jgi:urease accessory protein
MSDDAKTVTGWLGRLELGLEARGGRTVLARRSQVGPLTVQRPFYPEGDVCHLYLLHPSGGLVGGDRLDVGLDVASGASVLVTTPGAAKLYRSPGNMAVVRQCLKVGTGGRLEWLPQENILFRGARVRTETLVELAGDSRFIGGEMHCLGRPVIGERFDRGTADLILGLERDGRPLLRVRLRLRKGKGLEGPSGLRGFPVCGTFVAAGAGPRDLDSARQTLPGATAFPIGLTLVEDLLIARCLTPAVEPASRIFRSLWGILRPRLMGRDACPPRIWST